jgi:hypothetical protein
VRLAVTADMKDMVAIGTSASLETGTALINMMLIKVPHLVAAEARNALQARSGLAGTGAGVGGMGGMGGAYEQGGMGGAYEQLTLQVDPKNFGLLWGLKGKNIKGANAVAGVRRITVMPNGCVVVLADTMAAAEEAARYLEVVLESVPLNAAEVGCVIGKSGGQIQEIQEMSGCRMGVRQNADGLGARLEVLGPRRGVDVALALIKYTIETVHEQRDKLSQIYALAEELRAVSTSTPNYTVFKGAGAGAKGAPNTVRGRDRGLGPQRAAVASAGAGGGRGGDAALGGGGGGKVGRGGMSNGRGGGGGTASGKDYHAYHAYTYTDDHAAAVPAAPAVSKRAKKEVVAGAEAAATLPAATAAAVATAAVSGTGAGQGAGQKKQQAKTAPAPAVAGHDAKALVGPATPRETGKKTASGDRAAPAPAPPPAPVPPPGQPQQGKLSKKQKAAEAATTVAAAAPAGPAGSSGAAGMAPQEVPVDEFQFGLSLFTAYLHQPPAPPPAAAKSVAAPQAPPPSAAAAKPAKGNKNKGQSTAAGAAAAVALDEAPQTAGGKNGQKLEEVPPAAGGKDAKKTGNGTQAVSGKDAAKQKQADTDVAGGKAGEEGKGGKQKRDNVAGGKQKTDNVASRKAFEEAFPARPEAYAKACGNNVASRKALEAVNVASRNASSVEDLVSVHLKVVAGGVKVEIKHAHKGAADAGTGLPAAAPAAAVSAVAAAAHASSAADAKGAKGGKQAAKDKGASAADKAKPPAPAVGAAGAAVAAGAAAAQEEPGGKGEGTKKGNNKMKGATAREESSNAGVPAGAKDVGKGSDTKGSDTKGSHTKGSDTKGSHTKARAAKGPAPPLALAKLPPPLALTKLPVGGEKVANSASLGVHGPSAGGNMAAAAAGVKGVAPGGKGRRPADDGGKEAPGGLVSMGGLVVVDIKVLTSGVKVNITLKPAPAPTATAIVPSSACISRVTVLQPVEAGESLLHRKPPRPGEVSMPHSSHTLPSPRPPSPILPPAPGLSARNSATTTPTSTWSAAEKMTASVKTTASWGSVGLALPLGHTMFSWMSEAPGVCLCLCACAWAWRRARMCTHAHTWRVHTCTRSALTISTCARNARTHARTHARRHTHTHTNTHTHTLLRAHTHTETHIHTHRHTHTHTHTHSLTHAHTHTRTRYAVPLGHTSFSWTGGIRALYPARGGSSQGTEMSGSTAKSCTLTAPSSRPLELSAKPRTLSVDSIKVAHMSYIMSDIRLYIAEPRTPWVHTS